MDGNTLSWSDIELVDENGQVVQDGESEGSLLGQGSFGMVFRARWTYSGMSQDVALKVITRSTARQARLDFYQQQEDMRKECDKLVRLLKKKGVSQQVAEDYAQKMTDHKFHCDDGYLQSCNYCKEEYLKNQRTKKKRSKTPKVPREALPKSKSRSKKKVSRTRKKKKGPPESIAMKLHAMGRTHKLKSLKLTDCLQS